MPASEDAIALTLDRTHNLRTGGREVASEARGKGRIARLVAGSNEHSRRSAELLNNGRMA